jgi:hypothetical protein
MSTPFYDLASLVVVPSGYKSGKIYAQKPLTTDGQLTFTRASTATRVNASGIIETVASGVPRLDYLGSTCPKLQLEPQRSNLTLYSQQIDNAYWNKQNGTISANSTTSPDGTANADLFTENTATADHAIFDVVSYFVAGTTYTASFFVKANGRTKIELASANSNTCPLGRFDLTAKTATAVGSSFNAKIEDYGNGWFRCSVSRVAANTGLDLPYYAMCITDGVFSYAGNGTSGMYFWGMQMEAGAYATSYIPTTSAAVTRLADAAQKDSITSLIGQTAGTIYWESNQIGGAQISLNASASVSSDGVQIYASGNTLAVYIQQGGTARLITTLGAVTQGSNFKIALAYGTNFVRAYINGVQTYTTSATIPMPTMAMLNLSFYGGGGAAAKSETKQVLLFKSILTNAQLAELTTL